MNQSQLDIATGIAQGVEKASQTLMGIMTTKYKLQQDKEESELDFKIKDLQLKKLGSELSPERLKMENDILKHKKKEMELAFEKTNLELDEAKKTNEQRLKEAQETWQSLVNSGINNAQVSYNRGGLDIKIGGTSKNMTERYRADLNRAQKGEISWEQLKNDYPDKAISGFDKDGNPKMSEIDKAQSSLPDLRERTIFKDPKFKEGGGVSAYFSKHKAKLNDITKNVIDTQLKTSQDFKDLLQEEKEGILPKDIDVDAILEYFGKTRDEVLNESQNLQKPDMVSDEDWKAATDEQKKDFLNKINRR